MKLLNETQLNRDRAIIQLLHGRLGLDLSRSMSYHTGNFWYIEHLNRKNILVANYLEILSKYTLYGNPVITLLYNVLSISEIESIIDDCYRLLNKYNTMDTAIADIVTDDPEAVPGNIFERPDGSPFERPDGSEFERPA